MKYMLAVVFALGTFSGQASAQDTSIAAQCVKAYDEGFKYVRSNQRAYFALETIAKKTCSSEASSLDAGFDSTTQTMINGVPGVNSLVGQLGISNNKQLCEAYRQGKITINTSNDYESGPVEDAMAQFNKCMEIAVKKNVLVTHEVQNPGSVMVAAKFLDDSDRTIRISAQTSGGFSCTTPVQGGTNVEEISTYERLRKKTFTVNCSRSPKINGTDEDYLPGSIAIAIDGTIYPITIPADSIFGADSRRQSDELIKLAKEETHLSKIAEQAAKIETAKVREEAAKKTYRSYIFYFGQVRWGKAGVHISEAMTGTHFPCAGWAQNNPDVWQPYAKNALCPDGVVKSWDLLKEYGGNECGYHQFSMVCERQGQ